MDLIRLVENPIIKYTENHKPIVLYLQISQKGSIRLVENPVIKYAKNDKPSLKCPLLQIREGSEPDVPMEESYRVY